VVSAIAPARSARQRELGQNFLVDHNILDVIERLAGVDASDVVLEVGGGAGVLSERLAASARWLHVVEVDGRLIPTLTGALERFDNVDLVVADAVTVDLRALTPAPTKMVANLPYGVAATVILRAVSDLPSIDSWVVMVQREVGERFAAAPGTPAYGVPSVLAQLACDVRVLRPISRQVFRPVPNVDSVLLGLTRRGEGADPLLSAVVHGAFAHRRKTLAGSLAIKAGGSALLAGGGGGGDIRARARAALVDLGHPADARAERLAPAEFRALARALGRAG
jgi:16S rRNA (adenine1518-N6/adenine1519-N6)-dimethyltransferase